MSDKVMIDYELLETAINNIRYAKDELQKRNYGGDFTLIINSLNETYESLWAIDVRRLRNKILKTAYSDMEKARATGDTNAYDKARERYNFVKERMK